MRCCVALHCTGEWRELRTRTEGRLVSYVQDWNDWWLEVVRDRPAGKLNGELQALPISGQSSPQVRRLTCWLRKFMCTRRSVVTCKKAGCRCSPIY